MSSSLPRTQHGAETKLTSVLALALGVLLAFCAIPAFAVPPDECRIANGRSTLASDDCATGGVLDERDPTCQELLAISDTTPVRLYGVHPPYGLPVELCDLADDDITFGAGLAQHPYNGMLYAALDRASGQQWLTILDLDCQVTDIDKLDPSMDAITFCDDGTLYGVDKSGWLYVIDPNDASTECLDIDLPLSSVPYEIACEPGTGYLYYTYTIAEDLPPPQVPVCYPHFGWIDVPAAQVHPIDPNLPEVPGAIAFLGPCLYGYGDSHCAPSPCCDTLHYVRDSDWEEKTNGSVCMTAATVWHYSPDCIGDIWPWGDDKAPCGNGVVDLDDLAVLLSNYGKTSCVFYCDGDVNCDGVINLEDLAALLGNWGPCTP